MRTTIYSKQSRNKKRTTSRTSKDVIPGISVIADGRLMGENEPPLGLQISVVGEDPCCCERVMASYHRAALQIPEEITSEIAKYLESQRPVGKPECLDIIIFCVVCDKCPGRGGCASGIPKVVGNQMMLCAPSVETMSDSIVDAAVAHLLACIWLSSQGSWVQSENAALPMILAKEAGFDVDGYVNWMLERAQLPDGSSDNKTLS